MQRGNFLQHFTRIIGRRMNAALKPLLIGLDDAAKLLSVSSRTVRQLAHDGTLGCVRIGRRLLFTREDLEEWVQSRRTPARPANAAHSASVARPLADSPAPACMCGSGKG